MWRAYAPAPRRSCPNRDAPPIWPGPPSVRGLDALPLPPPDGIGVPRGVQLPCDRVPSTNAACERTCSCPLLAGWIQDQSHGANERLPFRLLGKELFPAERGEAIVLGPFSLIRQLPRRRNPAFRFEAMHARVQRPGLDLEKVFRCPLDVLRNSMSVHGPGDERTQD